MLFDFNTSYFRSALVLGEREVTDWKKREIEKANTKYQLRIKALRNK